MDRLAEQVENHFQIKALVGLKRQQRITAVVGLQLQMGVKVLLSLPTPR
jgi:hypothetical protein